MLPRYAHLVLLGLSVAQLLFPASLGFDRNLYPGDANLVSLRKTFAFTGYWLNAPPGEKASSWLGKRSLLLGRDFGFLVLFNGRLYADLHRSGDPVLLGRSDAKTACSLANKEGFPSRTVIYLDQEEGGRLVADQRKYIHSWVDEVNKNGFEAGVYCSAIPFREGDGTVITTAQDIAANAEGRHIHLFVYQDTCPPSPGCKTPVTPPAPSGSGYAPAEAWQFAQSPRRIDTTKACAATYSANDLCLAPSTQIDIDISSASSPDPSHGSGR